jgi:predicted DNA-binding transcriptional regulator AlpA
MTPDQLEQLRSHAVTDVASVAPIIRRSRAATYRLAASGELPGVRKLGGRYVVITAELLRWLGLEEGSAA